MTYLERYGDVVEVETIEWCVSHGERGKAGFLCPGYAVDASDEALAECHVVPARLLLEAV